MMRTQCLVQRILDFLYYRKFLIILASFAHIPWRSTQDAPNNSVAFTLSRQRQSFDVWHHA